MLVRIISDLHLEENRPDITAIFLAFLERCLVDTHSLYILGDFFEVWIGDDDDSDFNRSIKTALRAATDKGLCVYFLPGNRDFLIGKRFLRETGCQLLPDIHVLALCGQKTLLMHGDTLCTLDKKYLKFRKKSRRFWFQQLFLLQSLARRRAIAKRYRQASQAYVTTLPDAIMDVTQEEVVAVMQKYEAQQLIHGHTHRPGVHEFTIQDRPSKRLVLGAWHEQGNALNCFPDGRLELTFFK